jgi:hypothetical protein
MRRGKGRRRVRGRMRRGEEREGKGEERTKSEVENVKIFVGHVGSVHCAWRKGLEGREKGGTKKEIRARALTSITDDDTRLGTSRGQVEIQILESHLGLDDGSLKDLPFLFKKVKHVLPNALNQ